MSQLDIDNILASISSGRKRFAELLAADDVAAELSKMHAKQLREIVLERLIVERGKILARIPAEVERQG